MKGEPKKITYVEDEADIRAVAELALTRLGGFDVDVCKDGCEALEHAPIFAPDLIILDVMMPGYDGPTLYKLLKQIPGFKTTPIIFMTAKVQKHEIQEYLDIGAADVIVKPFDPMTLSNQVKRIWSNLAEA